MNCGRSVLKNESRKYDVYGESMLIVHYIHASKFDVLTSVKFAERVDAMAILHVSTR